MPRSTMQKVCSLQCSIIYTREQAEKQKQKELAERKQALKSRSQWLSEAQQAFNEYIRERDKGKRCISCGRDSGAKMNAGHYLTVGAHPELRFNTYNVHAQCEHCNSYLSGNLIRYRPSLIMKIGLNRVLWLEGPHEPKNYTIDQIKRIKRIFKAKTKRLRHGRKSAVKCEPHSH